MPGTIHDTYAAALQHDLVEFDDGTALLGVVRRPTRWFNPQVDENLSALGPPGDLFEDFQDRKAALEEAGRSETAAHNAAWADVQYDRRYLEHLERSPDAEAALESIIKRLSTGEDVAVVCYENTEDKRCHRTVLREYVTERLESDSPVP